MYPHTTADCLGQFVFDDAESKYVCMVCGQRRDFYEW